MGASLKMTLHGIKALDFAHEIRTSRLSGVKVFSQANNEAEDLFL